MDNRRKYRGVSACNVGSGGGVFSVFFQSFVFKGAVVLREKKVSRVEKYM